MEDARPRADDREEVIKKYLAQLPKAVQGAYYKDAGCIVTTPMENGPVSRKTEANAVGQMK